MSNPPGPPDPRDPTRGGDERDPWATPAPNEQPDRAPYQPPYQAQPPYGQPPFGQPSYGQPQYGQQPYAPGYPPRTNGKATAALWTGIGSIVLSFCCLGFAGIVAIVLGVKARSEIRTSAGQQAGDGFALTGIITGAVGVVLSILVILLVVLAFASGSTDFSTSSGSGV